LTASFLDFIPGSRLIFSESESVFFKLSVCGNNLIDLSVAVEEVSG
jgi:hypothetical protein